MPTLVRSIMTANPTCLESTATALDAATCMRDEHVGSVLVVDGATLRGIVTDRDLTTRVLAAGTDPTTVTLGDICSMGLTAVSPDDEVSHVLDQMRESSVRRVPVVEDDVVVGIISLGDLAVEYDEKSVLADISAAPPDEQ